jgi:hypothetical protein
MHENTWPNSNHTQDRREPLMFQRTADRDGDGDGDGDGDEQAGCRQSSFHVVDRVG